LAIVPKESGRLPDAGEIPVALGSLFALVSEFPAASPWHTQCRTPIAREGKAMTTRIRAAVAAVVVAIALTAAVMTPVAASPASIHPDYERAIELLT
jgi:hypothetical protein